jgi:hypothetical protein
MVNLLKILLFFAFGILCSCGLLNFEPNCPENLYPKKFFGNKVQFTKYYSMHQKNLIDYFHIIEDKTLFSYIDSSLYQLSFNEDSTFSYLQIFYQYNMEGFIIQDTVAMVNGKFIISKDKELPWYILKLDADYVYKKEVREIYDSILYFTDFNKNKFDGFTHNAFTNVNSEGFVYYNKEDMTDSCFSLYIATSSSENYCGMYKGKDGCYWYLGHPLKTFCLKQPEETPEPNPTGDNL